MLKNYHASVKKWQEIVCILKFLAAKDADYPAEYCTDGVLRFGFYDEGALKIGGDCGYCTEFKDRRDINMSCGKCPLYPRWCSCDKYDNSYFKGMCDLLHSKRWKEALHRALVLKSQVVRYKSKFKKGRGCVKDQYCERKQVK